MIKRSCQDVETLAMENCLMLLSRVGQTQSGRVFKCKTCDKEFKSFQALGGHRASHKRLRIMDKIDETLVPKANKTHLCPVCGLEFAVGQALGGHMGRHHDGARTVTVMVTEKRGLCMDLNLTPFENELKVWNGCVQRALAI